MGCQSDRLVVVLAMRPELPDRLFSSEARRHLSQCANLTSSVLVEDGTSNEALADANVLLTGWGSPLLDQGLLERAPRLKYVVHAGGSVKRHVTAACWERGIRVSSAADANAVPVAEYTFAMILLAGKGVFKMAALYRSARRPLDLVEEFPDVGNFAKVVGVIGASAVGRKLMTLLKATDLRVLLYDPYVSASEAAQLGAEQVPDLDEMVACCDVLSVHAPALPETRHLIDEMRLSLLPDGATLVNTARGGLVDLDALTAELVSGRLNAVLDVTEPEVLPPSSPVWDLHNVILTPHAAGSLGNELRRLGGAAAEEICRLARGEDLAHEVAWRDLQRRA